ncbi:hypothetical protein MHU86_20744 [Fragilaria crotonensis]|nr:hypothetical protein MHU86_20744 [Fragilaria crotonensis]
MSPSPSDNKQRGKRSSPHRKKSVQRDSAGDRKRKAKGYERGRGGASRRRVSRAVSDVVGGRTFPGELSRYIIAGYENPRVFPGVPSTKADGQTKGKRKVFVPSGGQSAAVLSKGLPRHVSAFFTERFLHYQKAPDTASLSVGGGVPIGAKICKTTFVASIHFAFLDTFGIDNVTVERCEHMRSIQYKTGVVVVPHALEVVVLDAVLARSRTHPKPLCNTRATVDKPVKMHVDDDALLDPCHDARFRAMVVVLPEAGVFYCHRERRKACVGVLNSLVPLDMNWLRTLRNGTSLKRFAKNGYITHLWEGDGNCIWKWKVNRGSPAFNIPCSQFASLSSAVFRFNKCRNKTVYHVQQCADEDSPRLPPDFIDGEDCSSTMSRKELRRLYLMKYVRSPSARRGCRHYVAGFLHRNVDPESVWVVDAEMEGDVDLNVSTHIRHPSKGNDSVALFRDSMVQVRHLPALGERAVALLRDIHQHATSVRERRGSRGVRGNHGDHGSMHPVGTRIMKDRTGPWRTRYVTSSSPREQPALAACVRAAAQLASTSVPAVLRVMQDMEDDADLKPSGGMAGDGTFARVAHTMDVSVDLSNASHYDVNDASSSFAIWTEDSPGTTNNWYLVLPNVFGKKTRTGRTYNGVAIKLTHGTLISWDGRLIRHATSIMDRKPGCHVYGTFFGAKAAIVHYGVRRAIAAERQRRAYAIARRTVVNCDDGEPIVDIVPSPESKVIVDSDEVGLDGSVSSAESDDDSWIAALGSDLHLGDDVHYDDDDSTVDDGVPVSDAVEGDQVSDSGIWDEPDIAAWRIPRRSLPEVLDVDDDEETHSSSRLGSPSKSGDASSAKLLKSHVIASAFDKHLPDLMAPGTECWSCVACHSLCIDGGETSCRDALRFVSSGGSFRGTVDARETRHPNQMRLTNRQRLQPFCPFLGGWIDGNRVIIRVYYPYFRVKNGEVGSLFDVFHPRKVTAFHLIRASRVLVPCPHLQFHFEEFWKLLLPEFTTLRTGIEWVDEVAWYYIQMVRCKTRYPHILSTPPAFDTWIYVNDYDWAEFKKATSQNVMVGVSGDGEADARMVAIESLTPGTYLGGKCIYFPSIRLREVFARKFEPFLPEGARTHAGQEESDGSLPALMELTIKVSCTTSWSR